jgi:preprotein translocase subunit SecD
MKLAAGSAGALATGAVVIVTLALALILGNRLGAGLAHQEPELRTQLTVRIDTDAVPQMVVRTLFATVRDGLREPRLGFASIAPSGDSVEVTALDGVDRAQVLARLRELSRSPGSTDGAAAERFTIADSSGAVLRLTPTPAALAEGMVQAADQTIEILGRRIESLKLKPTFSRDGSDKILVSVSRQSDTTRLKELIVAPGKLAIRFVDPSMRVEEAKLGQVPPESEILQDRSGTPYLIEKRVSISGESLLDAQAIVDQRINEPAVTFRFNPAGTRQFARLTGEKVGSAMAVVLDGIVLAAPVIREPILGGSGQISGNFTVESANDLALLLRSGALPAPLTIVDERTLTVFEGPAFTVKLSVRR